MHLQDKAGPAEMPHMGYTGKRGTGKDVCMPRTLWGHSRPMGQGLVENNGVRNCHFVGVVFFYAYMIFFSASGPHVHH